MATRTRQQIIVRPTSGGGAISRSRTSLAVRERMAAIRRRTADSAGEMKLAACTIGAPVGMALLAKHASFSLPSIGGIHPHLLWGGVATIFGRKMFGSGDLGKMVRAAGLGLCASAASEITFTGSPLTGAPAPAVKTVAEVAQKRRNTMGEDEIGDDEVGDDEVGDEVGDEEVGDDEIGDDDY